MSDSGVVEQLPDRYWTVPNALSVLRVLAVPVFVYLILGPHADGWALAILMASGITDYLDGKLARLLNQSSRIGALLDPAADRLYMVVIPIAFAVRDIVPWWIVVVLFARDLILASLLPILRRYGLVALPVHYLGKAATFTLMYAFPMILIGQWHNWFSDIMGPCGLAFLLWGTVLYVWTALLYIVQLRLAVQVLPRVVQART